MAQPASEEASALAAAKREAAAAEARGRQLDTAAQAAETAADRARAEAVAIGARIQSAEAGIDVAEARVRLIASLRQRHRTKLAAQQGPLVRLTAALQTLARRPPALALAQPGSLDDIVHVRSLLAATLPVVRERTAALRADLAEAERLRTQADQALAALRESQERLETQRVALSRIEATERMRSGTLASSASIEQDRALAMGEDARDIVTLMRALEENAAVRERLAELPGPALRPDMPGIAPPPPMVARERGARPPAYRLPVMGDIVTGLGEVAESGVRARGLTVAPRAKALAVAPAGGTIGYAGPFQGYGRIVIIEHGHGWTSLVAGLDSVSVKVGEKVDGGSPIGRAGQGKPRITVELRRDGRPFDIPALIAARAA